MPKIEIYTTKICPYCQRAKSLFNRKQLSYQEINVEEIEAREKMMKRTNGARSVPQIFIDEKHIGGCDDLYALEQAGKLDQLLENNK